MSQKPQTQYEQELNSILSVPRRFGGLGDLAANRLAAQFQQMRRKLQPTNTSSGAAVKINPTLPKQVLSVSATQTASKQQDRTFSLVSVSFTRDASDPNYAGVRIWFKGYKGNSQWELVASGSDSPVSFLEEATSETVQVAVQAFNQSGFAAPFSGAPIGTVTLSGVVSAPPAPTVTQTLTPVPGGFQFTFSIEAGLLADVVDCYKVYRNTVNVSGSASVCQTIKHPQTNNGSYVVQDYPGGDLIYFYWVSAVNTVGLESSLTAAQSTTQNALSLEKGFGKNLLPNPGFEDNLAGVANSTDVTLQYPLCDGWQPWRIDLISSNPVFGVQHYTGNALGFSPHGGQFAGLIYSKNVTLAASTTYACQVRNTVKIPVAINDIMRVSGWVITVGTAPPAGIVALANISLEFYDASDNALGNLSTGNIAFFNNAWTFVQGALQIPATIGGSPPAYARAFLQMTVQNTNGSPTALSAAMFACFDDLKVVLQNTAYDLTPINTSGQPQTTVSPLSQSGATTTINVAATTWQFGDGTISYNGGSVNPGALGTWYIYASDPTYSGGAVTYVATANAWGILASNGYVYFGVITTVGGGGAAGAGGGTGGGGGGGKRSLT